MGDAGKKNTIFEVEGFLLKCTQEVENMMSCSFSRETHHVSVREIAVHVWRKGSPYEDLLFHANYEGEVGSSQSIRVG